MVRELIEKEVSAALHAVEAVRDWVNHPTTVMKDPTFQCALDDLGQTLDDLELPETPPEKRS
jgi:hypothetical protein